MNRYLLDTNHLSAYMDRESALERRIDEGLKAGDRIGICLPVLCEYRAGILLGRRHQRNLARLQTALSVLRLWPVDEETAAVFADIFREMRAAGKVLSQFDLLIAALVRQRGLILLTADQDFQPIGGLKIENWLHAD